ncbi:phage tail protein [Burkholderia sp. 22PA0106]|uniref:phage tail protein n=1 Tax=Burkholderia sp. 22PA0106 TaxID=3237371 RepID=UPI0039C26E10
MSDIVGYKKSGGGSSGPVEAPDSARSISYARVLDILSEGEIEGPVNGLQSVFFDGTPLQNSDGSFNFTGATVEFRPGSQDQTYIAGFPEVDNDIGVSVELKGDAPYVRAVTNLDLSALRVRISTQQWQKADTSTGNVGGYRVDYRIEVATDGGAYQVMLVSAFDFKVSSKYERTHRINLPPARAGWVLRVVRLTPNANSATVADTMTIESVTEVIDAKLRYPNSALAGISIDASQFNRIPTRSYRMRGRRVRVPSNYDPVTRSYVGAWDGTFKVAYTNNPAWIFYDLALHPRYGMGHRINPSQLDRYELYRIGQYCDELVPDGLGGQEPRMTCNLYLQTRGDATKVLNDLASVFRGMTYWAQSQIWAVADMPADPVYTYTAGNVIGGKFVRQGTSRKTRYTVALVSWCDPSNHFQQVVEPVEDRQGKLRYGVRTTELTAIGCTSRGQAIRLGKHALLTSKLETQEVAFSVGLDGVFARPGQIVRIADSALAGRPISGRIHAVDGRTITVDRDPVVKRGDTLIVNLPSGRNEARIVSAVVGRAVTVSADWPISPVAEAVWAVDADDLAIPTYRIVSVAERRDEKTFQFDITAVQHEPGKFDNVDFGTTIEARPITVTPPSVQPPPSNVRLSSYSRIDQGIAVTSMVVAWDAVQGAVRYEVWWRRDNGDWILAGRTGAGSIEVEGIYAGQYVGRVIAYNALNLPSLPAVSVATQLQGKTTPPPVVTFLRTAEKLFGIGIEWGFPDGAEDTQRTEVWYSEVNDRTRAQRLGDFPYPQNAYTMPGLAAGVQFFFWVRLVDRSGNVGAWFPGSDGVMGQSGSDAGPILEYIRGQLDKDSLVASLREPIEQIPAIAKQASDNAAAIVAEVRNRTDALQSEADARAAALAQEVRDRADALAEEALARGAAVSSESEARQSADESLGRRIDTVSAAAGDVAAAIQEEAEARVAADAATARRVETIEAKWSPALAGDASGLAGDDSKLVGVYTERDAMADAVSAVGRRVDAVTATVGKTSAFLTSEQTARVNADGALGQRIDVVAAQAADNAAAILSESTARAGADGALSQRIDAVKAAAGDNAAAITAEATARASADAATAKRVDGVEAKWSPALAGDAGGLAGDASKLVGVSTERDAMADAVSAVGRRVDAVSAAVGKASAFLTSEQTARVNADGALGQRVDIVAASVKDNAAAITAETTARADAVSALGQQITTVQGQVGDVRGTVQQNTQAIADQAAATARQLFDVQAQVGNTNAAVQTVSQSVATLDGQVSASYQIKTQVTAGGHTVMAGITTGVTGDGETVEGRVIVDASTFAVIDSSTDVLGTPFVVKNGQVFISQAFIDAGWLTTAMVGNYIQSDNYVSGRTGWRLDRNGNYENNGTGGSGRKVETNTSTRFYDAAGTLRIDISV